MKKWSRMMVAWGKGQEVHEALRARAQVTKERRSCRKADQEAEELWESRWTVRL